MIVPIKSHLVIGATHDNKMFRTEFHTSGNSGVKLPDYYKNVQSVLSKDKHLLVKTICNFLVYVRNHMKGEYKGVKVKFGRKWFMVYVHPENSMTQFYEHVQSALPKNFRKRSYHCEVQGMESNWLKIDIE